MARHKDGDWNLPDAGGMTWDKVPIAVLMDVRDELKKLNCLLNCSNFLAIPWTLKDIAANTKKKRKRRPAKKAVKP